MKNKDIQNEEYILQEVIVVKSLRDDKIHYLPKELIDEWLETFELKNLNDDFIPQVKNEIKPFLDNLDIHLKLGSLLKINERDRNKFVKFIRPTLENPDFVMKDDRGFIFIKDINKDKVVFTSIAKTDNNEYVITTNSFKRIKTLQNRLKANEAKVIYQSKEAPNILVEAFTAKPFPSELNETIPQNPSDCQTQGNLSTSDSNNESTQITYKRRCK